MQPTNTDRRKDIPKTGCRMWASKKIFDTEYIHISSGHGKNEDNVEIYAPSLS